MLNIRCGECDERVYLNGDDVKSVLGSIALGQVNVVEKCPFCEALFQFSTYDQMAVIASCLVDLLETIERQGA